MSLLLTETAACAQRCAPRRSRRHAARVYASSAQVAAVSFPEETEQAVEEERGSLSELSQWLDANNGNSAKRLQMQIAPVAADTTVLRSLDWDRARFDIEFGLSDGTTYNSYLIKGADKIALVDSSHAKFSEAYLAALSSQVELSKIDYLVVSHTEPDHSGLVSQLLEAKPGLVVVGSRVCLQFLANLVHQPFTSLEVKAGSKVELGGGHVLEFVPAPNLHWPDTMFSFDHATGALFTCDAFGAHYCSESVFDARLPLLDHHFRFYYDCLMRPNARSVLTALRKIEPLPVRLVATGHGPVLRHNVGELLGRYARWSGEAVQKAAAAVAVLYTADYGFGDRLSQSLARGLTKTEVEVVMVDLGSAEAQEVVEALGRAAAVVLLAPPSGRAAAPLAAVLAGCAPHHRFLLAESYGGADEPVDTLAAQLLAAGAQLAAPALRVRDTPSEGTYQRYEEAGTDLGQALTAKEALSRQKTGMAPALSRALGRISGGLYLLTAVRGDARSAMIASWVSQAAFEPPAITVAVAKDRAIESLMQVGDGFVLNCLPEGASAPIMRHFLKRFPPGADRFEGVAWHAAPACGAPVLDSAVAFLECKVVSRMEAADHWVVLAHVQDGATLQPDTPTAVHRRKVGSYY